MTLSPRRTAILVAAATASLAVCTTAPTLACAQPYDGRYPYDYEDCRHHRQGNAVAGAIIGGIAGAVIGHGVVEREDRGAGATIGALAGGSLGAGIGSSATRCDRDYRYGEYRYRPHYY